MWKEKKSTFISWIIGKDFMEECRIVIDIRKKEVRIRKIETRLKCKEDSMGHMIVELRQRRKE